MKGQFVTYEIAKKLKEFNHDIVCISHYDENGNWHDSMFRKNEKGERISVLYFPDETTIYAPLWQQAIDWLREKHNLHVTINQQGRRHDVENTSRELLPEWWAIISNCTPYNPETYNEKQVPSFSGTYELARENAILKALELIPTPAAK